MKEIIDAIKYLNTEVDVRTHCTKDCNIHSFLLSGGNKDRWCRQFCGLYKYRRGLPVDTNTYHVEHILLIDCIERHCFHDCAHKHCNNCTFRKYHEAYGK